MQESMTTAELERALAEARRELEQAQADMLALADANQRFHDFSLAVQGLEAWLRGRTVKGSEAITEASHAKPPELNGNSHMAVEQAIVRPRDAILRLTEEQPREWQLTEIVSTMQSRSWLDTRLSRPVEAVRAAANRLVDVERLLERVGRSSYRRVGGVQRIIPTETEAMA